MTLQKLISNIEFKLESLPQNYFLNYFESDFLPELKKIYIELQNKSNEQVDSLALADFQDEFKKIIG